MRAVWPAVVARLLGEPDCGLPLRDDAKLAVLRG